MRRARTRRGPASTAARKRDPVAPLRGGPHDRGRRDVHPDADPPPGAGEGTAQVHAPAGVDRPEPGHHPDLTRERADLPRPRRPPRASSASSPRAAPPRARHQLPHQPPEVASSRHEPQESSHEAPTGPDHRGPDARACPTRGGRDLPGHARAGTPTTVRPETARGSRTCAIRFVDVVHRMSGRGDRARSSTSEPATPGTAPAPTTTFTAPPGNRIIGITADFKFNSTRGWYAGFVDSSPAWIWCGGELLEPRPVDAVRRFATNTQQLFAQVTCGSSSGCPRFNQDGDVAMKNMTVTVAGRHPSGGRHHRWVGDAARVA